MSGSLQYFKAFGERRAENVKGTAIIGDDLYVIGDTNSFGRRSIFIAKYDLATDTLEKLVTLKSGMCDYSFDVDGGSICLAGTVDRKAFIAMFDESLHLESYRMFEGPRYMVGKAIEMLGQGYLYLAGDIRYRGRPDSFISYIPNNSVGDYTWTQGEPWTLRLVDIEDASVIPHELNIEDINTNVKHFEPHYEVVDFGLIDRTPTVHRAEAIIID